MAEPQCRALMVRREWRDVATRHGLAEEALDQFPADVGMGRAIITRPQLIVLDEPTSALDSTARRRLQRELGTAYFFISHDLSTVRFLSHRVAVLFVGKIVELAAEILHHDRR